MRNAGSYGYVTDEVFVDVVVLRLFGRWIYDCHGREWDPTSAERDLVDWDDYDPLTGRCLAAYLGMSYYACVLREFSMWERMRVRSVALY